MDMQKYRKFGAAFVVVQGLVTMLFPQVSVKFIKKMVGKNFENADELEAKPVYIRQLRAVGVGMVAAGGTDLLLQGLQEGSSEATETDQTDGDGDDE
jgi:uncharacterized protein YjeT (DUF2065 family)